MRCAPRASLLIDKRGPPSAANSRPVFGGGVWGNAPWERSETGGVVVL